MALFIRLHFQFYSKSVFWVVKVCIELFTSGGSEKKGGLFVTDVLRNIYRYMRQTQEASKSSQTG